MSARDRLVRASPALVALIVVVVLPFVLEPYWVDKITGWIPLAVAALGLNLLTGYNGQISVGHGAIYGTGAYTAALLITNWRWSFPAAIAAAAVVCFVVGVVIGLPALRIKGLYLALVTLAVATLFPQIVEQFSDVTKGSSGLQVTSPQFYRGQIRQRSIRFEAPGWTGLAPDQWKYLYFVVLTVLCFVIVRNLVNSRVGRAMVAIRDNEVAAETNGVNVAKIKVITFGISSALAGVGGAMLILQKTSANPSSFTIAASIYFLVAVVVGGPATILGPALGALFYGLFDGIIQPALPESTKPATPLILGVILILLMRLAPNGIAGTAKLLIYRRRVMRAASASDAAVEVPEPASEPTPDQEAAR